MTVPQPLGAPAPDDVVNGDRAPVTAAVVALLKWGTGRPMGEARVPPGGTDEAPDVTEAPELPYSIVYALPGGSYGGPGLVDPQADIEWPYQVTSVGADRTQAEWMRDLCHRVMVLRDADGAFVWPMTIGDGTSIAVMDRRSETPGGETPSDGTVALAETYYVVTTPIGEDNP